MNGHFDQRGQPPKGMWTFVLLHNDSSMNTFNHLITATTSTMIIYPPGTQINAVTYDGFHIYGFSIEETHLTNVTKLLGLDKIEEKLGEIDRIELDPDQANNLRIQLENILSYVPTLEEEVFSTDDLEMLLYLLPVKLLNAMRPHMNCTKKRLPKEKQLRYLDARSYMHTQLHENITVQSVAEACNLTERTLQNYFKEELNISPKRYIMVLRLRKINNILKKSHYRKRTDRRDCP